MFLSSYTEPKFRKLKLSLKFYKNTQALQKRNMSSLLLMWDIHTEFCLPNKCETLVIVSALERKKCAGARPFAGPPVPPLFNSSHICR